jgi:hypothetical protein
MALLKAAREEMEAEIFSGRFQCLTPGSYWLW